MMGNVLTAYNCYSIHQFEEERGTEFFSGFQRIQSLFEFFSQVLRNLFTDIAADKKKVISYLTKTRDRPSLI